MMCSEGTGDEKKKDTITVAEVKERIYNKEDVVLLDVRTPAEYVGNLGHIDSTLLIPVQELEQRLNELDKFKDKQIIVICRSGNRSGLGTRILHKAGYDAVNMVGGMIAFRRMEQEADIKKQEEIEKNQEAKSNDY
jgi:rhodanese-related sulfurtransferase